MSSYSILLNDGGPIHPASTKGKTKVGFGLISLFNGISMFVRYLMPKPYLE